MPNLHDFIEHSTATYIALYSSITGAFLIIYLIIRMKRKIPSGEKKRLEYKLFLCICILGLIMNLYSVVIVFVFPYTMLAGGTRIRKYTPDAVYVLYAASWSFFCDYVVFKNEKRLKNRRLGYIILLVANFMISLIMSFVRDEVEKGEISVEYRGRYYLQWIYYPVLVMVFLVATWFMVVGFRKAYVYHKKRSDPLPFRVDIFFYPWLIGVFAQFVLAVEIEGFCAAVSLFLVYWSFSTIKKYVDWDTELFNSRFLEYVSDYLRYIKMDIQTAFSLTVPGEKKELLDVMSEKRMDNACVIKKDNDDILVVSNVRGKLPMELMKRNIQDRGANYTPPISIVVKSMSRTASESVNDFVKKAYDAY